MNTASSRRERWVYGLHAPAGLLLGLPTLGLVADRLLGASEVFLLMVVAMPGFAMMPLLPLLAIGWAIPVKKQHSVPDSQYNHGIRLDRRLSYPGG